MSVQKRISRESWGGHDVYHVDTSGFTGMREKAEAAAKELGSLRNSIEDGDGNFVGLLAEFVFSDVFDAQRRPTYEYDCVRNGVSIDVKTKKRTVPPKAHYEASIADYNTDQGADVYYFASYNENDGVMSFLGYTPTDMYYEQATFHEEGELDPDNNFTFKADCYNLQYKKMNQVGLNV